MKFKGIDLLIKDKNIKVTSIEIANILKQENFIVNRKIEQEWDYYTIIQKWRIEKTEYSHELKDGGIVKRTYYIMESDMALYITSRFNNKNAKDAMCNIIKSLREAQEFIYSQGLLEEFNYYRANGKVHHNRLMETIEEYLSSIQDIKAIITNLIYKNLFGKTAKEIREEKGVQQEELTRDYFNPTELSRIRQGETFVRALIIIKANEGYSPLEILDCIENQLMYTEIYPI